MNKIVDDVLVRDFHKSDLHDLLDVDRLSFAEEFELTGFDLNRIKLTINQMFGISGRIFLGFSKLFGKEPGKFLVAEVNEKLIGTTMVAKRRKAGYI